MERISAIFIALLLSVSTYAQTISILGTATPAANWYIDYNMTQDPQNPLVWTINITLGEGEVKFRQDASWDVNWGGTDFPMGNAILNGPNIPVIAGNYDVVFNTGEPSYAFILNSSYGNVGIGTESPQEKLDVNGNIRLSGEIRPGGVAGTDGQVLKSNGNGTMGWMTPPETTSTSANGSVGYGTWGGCEMSNVAEYNPLSDPQAYAGDGTGYFCAISGDYAISGAPYADGPTGLDRGFAMFFKRNQNSGLWEIQSKVFNQGVADMQRFGQDVDINGDWAIVGAPGETGTNGANEGSASIFKRNPSLDVWEFQVKLFHPEPNADDGFGQSVAISQDYAVIGAPGDEGFAGINTGSVCIFKRNTSTDVWEFDAIVFDPDWGSWDGFGASVGLSGEYFIAGAPNDDYLYGDEGSASIFRRNPTSGIWELQGSKLRNINPEDFDNFGVDVSISYDFAIVGSNWDDETAGSEQGSAVIFHRDGNTGAWTTASPKLTNSGAAISDEFGISVSISGSYAIVGSWADDEQKGSATIYVNTGSIWQMLQKVTDPSGFAGDGFGGTCDIDGTARRFITGAPGADGIGSGQGKVVFGKVE